MTDPANPINPADLLKFIKAYPTPAMDPAKEYTINFSMPYSMSYVKFFLHPIFILEWMKIMEWYGKIINP